MIEHHSLLSGTFLTHAEIEGDQADLTHTPKAVYAVLTTTAKATESDDTMDIILETSFDRGDSWVPVGHFTQLLGNGTDAGSEIMVFCRENPGTSAIAVTSDPTSGVVRPSIIGNSYRVRYTVVNNGTDNASFAADVDLYAIH
jgi:hypothetical protein